MGQNESRRHQTKSQSQNKIPIPKFRHNIERRPNATIQENFCNGQAVFTSCSIHLQPGARLKSEPFLHLNWFQIHCIFKMPRITIIHAAAFFMMFSKHNHSLGNASNNFVTVPKPTSDAKTNASALRKFLEFQDSKRIPLSPLRLLATCWIRDFEVRPAFWIIYF